MSHPQTASILAQHEAANMEYEREVLKRNREIKANTPRVSGRGGIGNITESHPKSPTKPLRRASLFKGGGARIAPLSPPSDMLDMNAYDENERRKYAQNHRESWRSSARQSSTTLSGPGSGGNSPLSPDSEYSGSDKASACGISIRTMSSSNFAISEPTGSPTSPSREKHPISVIWKKVVRSSSRSRRPQKQQDTLVRAEMATSSHPPSLYDLGEDDFPDFLDDPPVSPVSSIGYAL